MKTVSGSALTEINKLNGTEPLIIIGIEWVTGSVTYYADKELTGVRAKLLSVGGIESVVIDNRTSQNVEITLDDTDGELKGIIDNNDIHKVNATVYQYYGALSNLSDKFVLFSGQISTPFTWSEKERSISFSIVSEIESYEVGFSPEEGQLDFVNEEYIGKPWPLCFGSVVHSPAQRTSNTLEGQLLDEICIIDQTLIWKLEQLRLAFYQQAFLMWFFRKVADGARLLAPPVEDILAEYVKAILEERNVMSIISALLDQLDHFNRLMKKGMLGMKPFIVDRQNQLDVMAFVSNIVQLHKEYVESLVSLAEFKYNVEQDALTKCIEAYNTMRAIYAEYVATQTEICKENECNVTQVRIQNGKKFPQGVMTDVYVNNVKLRGIFNQDLFTFLQPPTSKYENIEVDVWKKDDDTCVPDDITNGVNIFWLKELVDLTGLYLLVKKRGTEERHILKVDRQVGLKVYFTLVPYAVATGGNGPSIDDAIGRLAEVPFVPTPWGGTLPQDIFNESDWLASEWNQPEPLRLLEIIDSIPGGVNGHELELLAKLVYLAPHDQLGGLIIVEPTARDVYTIIGEDIEIIQEASGIVHLHWLENYSIRPEEIPSSLFWQAEAGTTVRLQAQDCVLYIANILPSTVHAVFAYRTLENGSRIFAPVPSSYYVKNEAAPLGTITVTSFTFPTDLKNIPGEGWEDQPYITLTSSVGPNVVDVIEHLIETYSTGAVNVANFAATKAKFKSGSDELYPVGFTLFDRPNVLDEISRIAWEARCGIYRVGNEFFLKYLSEEPTQDVDFTVADVDSDQHYSIVFPDTDGLITRLVAFWHRDYKPLENGEKPDRLIYRHNVKKYGMHSEDIEFHIYNVKELVEKSATFWLIRKSNTWKQVTLKTFLKHIRLDPFDTIRFDLDKINPTTQIKSVIKSILYDTENNSLNITAELPVRSGETTVYPFYWPAGLSATAQFPTAIEIEEGFAGGFGPGDGVVGNIDDC